jgi:hypothetical protein
MNKTISFLAIGAFLVLLSCGKEHFYTRTLVNNTEYDVMLVLFGQNQQMMGDTVMVKSLSTTIIQDHYSQNRPKKGLDCAFFSEPLLIYANGRPAELSRPLHKSGNWEKDLIGKRSLDQDCFFEINSEDIEILPH